MEIDSDSKSEEITFLSLPVMAQEYYSCYGNKKLNNKAVAIKMVISFKKDVTNKFGALWEIGIDLYQAIIEDSITVWQLRSFA